MNGADLDRLRTARIRVDDGPDHPRARRTDVE
jgi:hypothetical protein